MSTPTTLKAQLTGDVGQAQAAIHQLIKTVEDLGASTNASSQVAQKAFKAEVDEVRRLATELGASEKQMGRLENAVRGFDQRVATEHKAAAQAADELRRNYAAAGKDVVSGLGEIATAGKLTNGALRDLVQGAGEMALAFGPQSVFMGAIAVATASIITMFVDARTELETTQREFKQRLETMRREANIGGLREEAIRAEAAARAAQEALAKARAQGVGEGSPLARMSRAYDVWSAERAARQANAARDAAFDAYRNPGGGPRTGTTFPTQTITANAPSAEAKTTADRAKAAAERNRRALTDAQNADMQAFGLGGDGTINMLPRQAGRVIEEETARLRRQLAESTAMLRVDGPGGGMFDAIEKSATRAVGPLQALRLEMGQTGEQMREVGRVAKASIPGAIAAGVDAIVSGQGNAIKAMKRALAEPIVMHLKAKAVEGFALAASYAGNPAMWPLIPAALAGAGKSLAAAAVVSRLGGVGGSGDSAGGSGGNTSTTGFGRGATTTDTMVRGSGSDRPVRIEMIVVQKAPDGRELTRQRQMIQRLDDRNQPLRVTL